MNDLNRRNFIGLSCSVLALTNYTTFLKNQDNFSLKNTTEPVRMLHATDLYHTHGDPDDHWDLACIYALAFSKNINLEGVLIDYPPTRRLGDPDVMGVAQMNYLTGLVAPAVVGTPFTMNSRNDIQPTANKIEHQGIDWVIDTLRNSRSKIIINIVGSATDIAIAAKKEPILFKEKCEAIYLNAGSAYTGKNNKLEFNVKLNPSAYAAIFDVLCPVYWLPCWNDTELPEVGLYGSYYRFIQNDILPHLSKRLQNFLVYILGQKNSYKWLEYLNSVPDNNLLAEFCKKDRNMWCTAGFFHAAGKKVTSEGEIISANSEKNSVFAFKPAKVICNDDGYTTWKEDSQSKNRYIFHVQDVTNYQGAMTLALKNLLLQLPD